MRPITPRPPSRPAALWAARTPPGFTFNVKAFSLFTQHPTPVAALPKDLRPVAEATGNDRVYLKDVGRGVADQAWATAPRRWSGQPASMVTSN